MGGLTIERSQHPLHGHGAGTDRPCDFAQAAALAEEPQHLAPVNYAVGAAKALALGHSTGQTGANALLDPIRQVRTEQVTEGRICRGWPL